MIPSPFALPSRIPGRFTAGARPAEQQRPGSVSHYPTSAPANPDRFRDLQDLASDEAARHTEWSEGLTPSEYLLALVDRAQARKNRVKEVHGDQ